MGQVIGNYEIMSELGRGGMGVVYKAVDRTLHREVAIKVLSPHLANDPQFVARFLREARAAAQLDHPNIARMYEAGQAAVRPYIVMEYVKGNTLAQWIHTLGTIAVPRALQVVRDVAEALAAAHAAGVVHRDIKPGNIMIDETGRAKVMDFGLAKFQGSTSGISVSGAVLGTPLYMSPEQIQGRGLDPRSDLYALGVTLYEMLTGKPPFEADTPVAVMYQIIHTPFPDVSSAQNGIPSEVARLVARMTARNLEDRSASAHVLTVEIAQIRRVLTQTTLGGESLANAGGDPQTTSPGSLTELPWLQQRMKRRVSPLAAGVSIAVFVGVVLTAWMLGSEGTRRPSAGNKTTAREGAARQSPQQLEALDKSLMLDPSKVRTGGHALRFAGDYQELRVPDSSSLDFAGACTLEAWIKEEAGGERRQLGFIVSKNMNGKGYAMLTVGGGPRKIIESGGWRSKGAPVPGVWTHVAAVWENGQSRFYFNGKLDMTANSPEVPQPSAEPLYIGYSPFGADTGFYGVIDEVRIWSSARTEEQIRYDMFHKPAATEASLRACWDFDEGSGTGAHDLAHGNNGVLGQSSHAPTWVDGVAMTSK